MTQEHTRGPWFVHKTLDEDYSPFKRLVLSETKTDYFCAEIEGNNAPADASLIAAAPELLEALKFAEEWMAAEAKTANGTAFHRDLATIRATISKAEGRK